MPRRSRGISWFEREIPRKLGMTSQMLKADRYCGRRVRVWRATRATAGRVNASGW